MRRESRIVAGMLVLALAAASFGAQPLVLRPLPEATILSSIDGKLLRADANDTWWFELTTEFKGDTFRVPSGRRFVLLPSQVLEQLIADVNDRVTPAYRLSAQVTRYQGANYLLATYFLPLSKFKDTKPQTTGGNREVAAGDLPTDPELAIPREIAEKLKDSRPVRGPLRKPSDVPTTAQPQAYLGRMLVNRVGLIEMAEVEANKRGSVEGLPDSRVYASTLPRFHFTPYALGWNISDERYELLPCGALEQAQQVQRNSIEPVRFNVAGLVTQFGGRPYLLLQRAVPVYNYGNFGR
ncbi:MAG TPA: hypothetical protein VLI39_07090 [Sedimentisphaerales bacterium]|nr:hypothetical protein [Sedimentisphaerales bacterium]